MTSSKWSRYVARMKGSDDQAEVAATTGINQATISRWLRDEKHPTEAAQVAKFAQGYGRPVLEAFVAADMLSLAEVKKSLSAESLALLADLDRNKPGRSELAAEDRADIDAAKSRIRRNRAKKPVVGPTRSGPGSAGSKRDAVG